MKQHSAKIKFGMQKRAEDGHIPFKAPMGYSHMRINSSNWVCPNDDARIIKEAFSLYATNTISLNNLALHLQNKYNRPIHRSNLHRNLRNVFYIGKIFIKDKEYKHDYETFIDEDIFNKVQEVMSGKPRKQGISNKKYNHLYKKSIRCSQCNTFLVGDIKKEKYTYYICANKNSGLPHKALTETTISTALLPILKMFNIDDKIFKSPNKMHTFLELVVKSAIGDTQNGTVFFDLQKITDTKVIASYINEDILPTHALKTKKIDTIENKIYGLNPLCKFCKTPKTQEEIMHYLSKDVTEVQQLLFDLEMADQIEQDESGRWKTI